MLVGDWLGKYYLQNHIYLILEDVGLEGAIAFEYRNSLSIATKAD